MEHWSLMGQCKYPNSNNDQITMKQKQMWLKLTRNYNCSNGGEKLLECWPAHFGKKITWQQAGNKHFFLVSPHTLFSEDPIKCW